VSEVSLEEMPLRQRALSMGAWHVRYADTTNASIVLSKDNRHAGAQEFLGDGKQESFSHPHVHHPPVTLDPDGIKCANT
jgi:hypothetical protein